MEQQNYQTHWTLSFFILNNCDMIIVIFFYIDLGIKILYINNIHYRHASF